MGGQMDFFESERGEGMECVVAFPIEEPDDTEE